MALEIPFWVGQPFQLVSGIDQPNVDQQSEIEKKRMNDQSYIKLSVIVIQREKEKREKK